MGGARPRSEGGGAGGLDPILKGRPPHPDCFLPVQGVTLTDLKEAEKAAGRAPEAEKSNVQSLVRGVR